MTHWSLKCSHMYIYHKCLIFSYWSGKYSSNQEKNFFIVKKSFKSFVYMCVYLWKVLCVICNTIVNEECKYILNHNKVINSCTACHTLHKNWKKNIGTKFVHRICTTDIPNWDLLFLVVKPVFRLSFWPPDISRKSQRTKAEPEQFFTKGMISQQVFFSVKCYIQAGMSEIVLSQT